MEYEWYISDNYLVLYSPWCPDCHSYGGKLNSGCNQIIKGDGGTDPFGTEMPAVEARKIS
ncbi:MAG: hypothetical protein GY702_04425 [Desulfobulbaceae bacterium]|nr:hypothetical protein [Desulfobulbaceae bacterium]